MKIFFTALAALAASALASDVLILDESNFDQEVGGAFPVFVEFFAPWCGHCKKLAPEYEVLATAFKGEAVKIASVDADQHRSLGGRFGVTGFPTLKYFPAGSQEPVDYQGGRTAADLTAWINKEAGTNAKIAVPVTAVTVLTPNNFDDIVKSEDKDVLVEFYAPWCGHCKRLAPDYEKVAESFVGDDAVVVANLDADAHREIASQYDVSGYPTIMWFPKGNKKGEKYQAGRAPQDFIDFLNTETGSQRTLGGGYLPEAGRIESFDALASQYIAADADTRADLLAQATALEASEATNTNAKFAKFYAIYMKRIAERGDDYVATEIARLNRMSTSPSVAVSKRGDFSKRANILSVFSA